MKFLFASDSFKGSLTSRQTIELLDRAAHDVFPDCETEGLVVADGGEGTVDSVVLACGGEKAEVFVHGPLFEPLFASYGLLSPTEAIVELAAASGLPLVPPDRRDPRYTTTYGTGELIRDALERGCRTITVAIGGSATNDGGMGCMRALGVRFLDAYGEELEGCGQDLNRVAKIDTSGLDSRFAETKVTVLCDVSNPLCGENGAAASFGAQKGAGPAALEQLEAGMRHYCSVLTDTFGVDANALPGGGAAGGMGAALSVFLHAELCPGIQTILDRIGFDRHLDGVSLVVTGEGRTDLQSCSGKVIQGIGERCQMHGIPAVGLVGSIGEGGFSVFSHGIGSLMTAVNAPLSLEDAMQDAGELYFGAAVRMFRFLRVGMQLSGT